MTTHLELDPNSVDVRALFNIMTGSIVPRPIAWVSTLDLEGRRNLAPYSMFTAVCAAPADYSFLPQLSTSRFP